MDEAAKGNASLMYHCKEIGFKACNNDIMLYIFSYLQPKELAIASLVTKRWQSVISENQLVGIAKVRNELLEKGHVLPDAVIYQIIKLKKSDLKAALELLLEYVIFRKEEFAKFPDPDGAIKKEQLTRKAFWWQSDKIGRPCLIIRPKFHIPHKKNYTLLYAIHMFEYACDIVWKTTGIKNFCVILDFEGFGTKNFDLNFARTFITWSRKYYKNLLGACYCVRSPKYALWCWSIVKLFVPAETLKKIYISKDKEDAKQILMGNFDSTKLPSTYGGTCRVPVQYKL